MATISLSDNYPNNTNIFDIGQGHEIMATTKDSEVESEEALLDQVNSKMTTAWDYFTANWWRINKDEDETDGKEKKAANKRLPIGRKEYAVLVATILGSLGLQVLFRDEPIMKGTTGATINAVKISYIQIPQGTSAKYVMRAVAVAALIAGIVFYYVPEDSHGVIRILRAAPFTDMFMAIILKCDVSSAKLDKLLIKGVKKCTNVDLHKRVAKAITKAMLAITGGALMNIPQYTGPFIASGAAVLAKANMRAVVDTLYQTIDKSTNPFKKRAAIAAVLGTCAALTAASAYTLTLESVRNSSFSWLPAAALVIGGDTLGRTIKQSIKSTTVPKDIVKKEIKEGIREPEQPTPWWRKCLTVASGVGLLATTVGLAYAVGPATLPTAAGASVTTNSGILTTICQEMGSMLKIASGKILPESVALGGALGLLGLGAGYHLYETIAGSSAPLLSRVTRATGAAFLAAVESVASYELKDHLRGGTNPDYVKGKKKKKTEVELPVL